MTAAPVLSVRELSVALRHGRDYATVVDAVSFNLVPREDQDSLDFGR